jgi:hypothetical protein
VFDRRDQGTQRRDGLLSIADRHPELLAQFAGLLVGCSCMRRATARSRASLDRAPFRVQRLEHHPRLPRSPLRASLSFELTDKYFIVSEDEPAR